MKEFLDPLKKYSFSTYLEEQSLSIQPSQPEILQLNLGYLCNQQCTHCHVDASPYRKELMSKSVMEECLVKIDELGIKTVDLTGGAPEMNPNFEWLIQELSKKKLEIIVRSNLTILVEGKFKKLPEFFKKHKIRVISSLPCYTENNVDQQRGNGVFNKSIKALKILNELGYGKESDFILDLVYNPSGLAISPDQKQLEATYKVRLQEDFGIIFNQLFCITNLPISRFLDDLLKNGTYEVYMQKLVDAFNPKTTEKVMCTNTLSISYQGEVFDCDFNQMLKLKSDKMESIKDLSLKNILTRKIKLDSHCFGCTAGNGSSCQGSVS